MPEQFKQVARTISKHQGEKDFKPKYAKLARKITDRVDGKLKGIDADSPEYWGLRELITEDEVDVALHFKLRKWYTLEQIIEMNKKQFDPVRTKEILDLLCVHGLIEYDYGDHYDDNGPIKEYFDENLKILSKKRDSVSPSLSLVPPNYSTLLSLELKPILRSLLSLKE